MSDLEPQLAPEPRREQRDPIWNWGDALVFLGLLVAALLAAVGMTRLFLMISGLQAVRPSVITIVAQFLAFALATLALALLLRTRYDAPFWRSLGWRMEGSLVIPAFVSGILLAMTVSVVNVLLGTKPVKSELEEIMHDPGAAPLLVVLGITLAPFFEELFFRGFLQPLLVRSLGVFGGLLLSGGAFASLHGPQYQWSWRYLASVTLAGVTFAAVRHWTGSTALAALMHAGYNFMFFAAFFISQKGLI